MLGSRSFDPAFSSPDPDDRFNASCQTIRLIIRLTRKFGSGVLKKVSKKYAAPYHF
jgi:hypothetical protein